MYDLQKQETGAENTYESVWKKDAKAYAEQGVEDYLDQVDRYMFKIRKSEAGF